MNKKKPAGKLKVPSCEMTLARTEMNKERRAGDGAKKGAIKRR